ncbi:bifunctional folylpolyglutamate synthase/dihydrofolate synthase [Weissella viridescens]|uniref:tetrahydrofolate synthase n=1 Tax=Weissella viridescens TaxID=1629 RepID=A0A3P2RLN0_WEIVI|nr:cyanophycin synthetase [Weissella viridescens]RRG18378.1 bifunctional folylpolyglutamate synthase/dihydrofolate synthase [Weissella viridescens]
MTTYSEILASIPRQMKYDPDVDRIGLLHGVLNALDHPQAQPMNIHICGTNGKGSTGAIVSEILQTSGQKVGHFVSPAMYDDLDQVSINGQSMSEAAFLKSYAHFKRGLFHQGLTQADLSIFETFFIISVLYFADEDVDVAIYECGLGGEFDATNALGVSAYTIFTKIALDHMQILGDTLPEIAQTKSKIIDPDSTVINYPKQQPDVTAVLKQTATACNAAFIEDSPYRITVQTESLTNSVIQVSTAEHQSPAITFNMAGAYQIDNLQTALTWLGAFNQENPLETISLSTVTQALADVTLAGRMELVHEQPEIIIDGAHNVDGIQALVDTLGTTKRYTIIVGFLRDKDYSDAIDALKTLNADFIITSPDNPDRALPKQALADSFKAHGVTDVHISSDLTTTFQGLANCPHPIIVTGSFYLINQVRAALKESE